MYIELICDQALWRLCMLVVKTNVHIQQSRVHLC